MKKILPLLVIGNLSLVIGAARADTAAADSYIWRANLRRIGFNYSSVNVANGAYYKDSPISALNTDSQNVIGGTLDFALQHNTDNIQWDNSLLMEYQRTKISPLNAAEYISENKDNILASSDFSDKLWRVGDHALGPMARAQYQTEFTANGDIPRQNLVRANGGLKLFDGAIIKELYTAGVYEYDFTYHDKRSQRVAGEFGWRLEYDFSDDVKFTTNGYYREYFTRSVYIPTDLERDLYAIARMDVKVFGNLSVGSYASYRMAKALKTDHYGNNLTIGLSFSYSDIFKME